LLPAADEAQCFEFRLIVRYRGQLAGRQGHQAWLYTVILRHIVLVMVALAICAVTAAMLRDRTDTQAPPPAGPGDASPAGTGPPRTPPPDWDGTRGVARGNARSPQDTRDNPNNLTDTST